jgi:predicted dehydrogenase
MKEIRVGFIGAGDIANIHKTALLRIPGVKLTAVYDIENAKSSHLASSVGAKIFSGVQDLVESPEVDVVYILTPQRCHYEAAILSLKAGKHTFIEKPVSLSKAEIREMIYLSEKHSCLCVPGHNYIHASDLKLAKELLDTNQLGDIRGLWIFFMVTLPPAIRSRVPGPLREVMIHQFYSTLFLVGKPTHLFAASSDFASRGPHDEDQVALIGKLPNGGILNLFASFAAEDLTVDPWTLKYKIVGSRGSASHTWSQSRLADRPQPVWDLPAYWETFREEDRYFVEECLRGGKPPLSSMQDALTCLDLLEAAETSIKTGSMEKLS